MVDVPENPTIKTVFEFFLESEERFTFYYEAWKGMFEMI